GLAELTTLRKSLLAWLRSADEAGLDEAGMIALFTSALRDFHDRRGEAPGPVPRGGAGPGTAAEGAEGVAWTSSRPPGWGNATGGGAGPRPAWRPGTWSRWSARTARARPRCCPWPWG